MPPTTNSISGGCLCGAIRYELDIGGPSGWPPTTHTCQCTNCRKRSGALVSPWIDTTVSRVTWSSPSSSSASSHPPTNDKSPSSFQTKTKTLPSFTEFSAKPFTYRGFCTTCGSQLTWRCDESPDEMELATGTLDKEWLEGEMGKVLGRASEGHFYSRDMIEGVTDLQAGIRWKGGEEGEVVGGGV